MPENYVEGIDVSHWNGKLDFKKLAAAGARFCFAKCVDGATNTDDQYLINQKGARAAGLLIGAYIFVHPTQDPIQQADHLLARQGKTDLPPVLDLEWDFKKGIDQWSGKNTAGKQVETPALSPAQRIDHIVAMIRRIELQLGRPPIIYTSLSFWQPTLGNYRSSGGIDVSSCPLWIVDYNERQFKQPRMAAPWKVWSFRQYDGQEGRLAGAVGSIDRNWFNGSLDQLQRFARGA